MPSHSGYAARDFHDATTILRAEDRSVAATGGSVGEIPRIGAVIAPMAARLKERSYLT